MKLSNMSNIVYNNNVNVIVFSIVNETSYNLLLSLFAT